MNVRVILIIIVLAAACTDHTSIPSGIMKRDKMEKVLWDMVRADRFVNGYIMSKKDSLDAKKKEAAVFYERVFKMNGISRDEFIKSYKYYLGRPDLAVVMFDSISAQAERRKAEPYALRRNALFGHRDSLLRADSIRKRDSIETEAFKETTGEMSDSALRKALYKQ